MLIPVLHRLLVRPAKLEEANQTYKKMKELGLAIAETQDKKREDRAVEIGEVIAVGDTAFKDFGANVLPVVGDTVYYAKYSGKWVKDGEEELLLLNDEDVCCILKKGA